MPKIKRIHYRAIRPVATGHTIKEIRNNYKVPLTNGDFVLVTSIGKAKVQANLHFQQVKVRAMASDEEYELLLSLDIFLDKKMYGMPKPELFRWWYTAVTRAKKELNLENEWWVGP